VTGDNEFRLVDGAISLAIDARIYRLSAVKKTAYRLAERCTAVISAFEGDSIRLDLRFKTATTEEAARETARLFFQELLDQELREQIAEETTPIRTLIMAHAFSKVDLIKRDE
jgi:His-Xaa-Ser system protein HxsD